MRQIQGQRRGAGYFMGRHSGESQRVCHTTRSETGQRAMLDGRKVWKKEKGLKGKRKQHMRKKRKQMWCIQVPGGAGRVRKQRGIPGGAAGSGREQGQNCGAAEAKKEME